jgi:zinc and cadmium transporter
VLLHGGWKKGQALLFNFLSGLTFLLGGVIAYAAGQRLDVT